MYICANVCTVVDGYFMWNIEWKLKNSLDDYTLMVRIIINKMNLTKFNKKELSTISSLFLFKWEERYNPHKWNHSYVKKYYMNIFKRVNILLTVEKGTIIYVQIEMNAYEYCSFAMIDSVLIHLHVQYKWVQWVQYFGCSKVPTVK